MPSVRHISKTNFYPRSPCGERRYFFHAVQIVIIISIHALLAESDMVKRCQASDISVISIHALLAESDVNTSFALSALGDFYPRSPCGERLVFAGILPHHSNFYPRSPCGERQPATSRNNKHNMISIHALLAESDRGPPVASNGATKFLSTLSLRRATCYSLRYSASGWHFYPRSPCGERRHQTKHHQLKYQFLSTLSLRRATETTLYRVVETQISIHALLAESDVLQS